MGEREQCWVINNEVIDPPPAHTAVRSAGGQFVITTLR